MTTTSCIPSLLGEKQAPLSADRIVEALVRIGVEEFCVCPGGRNAPLVYALSNSTGIRLYHWPEERCAAFFALGRMKATDRPVAVTTTSGTAAAELLPAVMEAYYSGLPLIVVTADRPRRFRGTGAPQSAEQKGLFGQYVHAEMDIEEGDLVETNFFPTGGPIHINIRFEEPEDAVCRGLVPDLDFERLPYVPYSPDFGSLRRYSEFIKTVRYPLVIAGPIRPSYREETIRFLLSLKAPIYAEAHSGIREDPRLAGLRVRYSDRILEIASENGYPIDGVLRIGNIPTNRLWRDLEETDEIQVCSVSDLPFSGLSRGDFPPVSPEVFFNRKVDREVFENYPFSEWLNADERIMTGLYRLFEEEPLAEPSLVHALSRKIPRESDIYLGNSLPVREWDLGASHVSRGHRTAASRGLNGIDGQLSTFLGLCTKERDNWALLGDLTLLYDMAAPWIFNRLEGVRANVVVVNNRGGNIFSRMFEHPDFLNSHSLSFKHLAKFWSWRYEKWESVPEKISSGKGARLIELVPHPKATERFWTEAKKLR